MLFSMFWEHEMCWVKERYAYTYTNVAFSLPHWYSCCLGRSTRFIFIKLNSCLVTLLLFFSFFLFFYQITLEGTISQNSLAISFIYRSSSRILVFLTLVLTDFILFTLIKDPLSSLLKYDICFNFALKSLKSEHMFWFIEKMF